MAGVPQPRLPRAPRAAQDPGRFRRSQPLRSAGDEALRAGVLSDRAGGGEGGQVKAEKPVFPERRAKILVAGDVMLDRYWFGEVSRISPEAPVPIVKIETDRTKESPGGAA